MGTPPEHWYYAGPDQLFFAAEEEVYHGEPAALALPAQPPALRQELAGSRELALEPASLLTLAP
jgi:hypothetical protein